MRVTRQLRVAALILLASSLWLLFWSLSSAQLRFHQCAEGYSLMSSQPGCRLPVLLEVLAASAFVAGVLLLVVAARWRRIEGRPDEGGPR